MKQNKNKKKWIAAATALATVAIIAGTFAWFVSEDNAKNHFEGDIAGNDIEIVETFTPPTDWKPGEDVNKDVAILNTGNYESLIRVSFKELLTKLTDAEAKTTSDTTILNGKTKEQIYLSPLSENTLATGTWADSTITPAQSMTVAGGEYEGTYTLKAKEQVVTTASGTTFRYVSYWENGTTQEKYYAKVGSYSRNETSGAITPAGTAEFKYVDLAGTEIGKDWTDPLYTPTITVNADGTAVIDSYSDTNIKLNFVNLSATPAANKWYYNDKDGHFYFVGKVAPQAQTAQLLDSVLLSTDAGNSYSKMKYDLDVLAKGIQADKEVVNSSDWVNNTNATLKDALEALF